MRSPNKSGKICGSQGPQAKTNIAAEICSPFEREMARSFSLPDGMTAAASKNFSTNSKGRVHHSLHGATRAQDPTLRLEHGPRDSLRVELRKSRVRFFDR